MPPEGSGEGGVPCTSAMQNYIKEETLSIPRDRRNNGNEIGENIADVKREPGHGIHIHRTFDQQRNAERLSQKVSIVTKISWYRKH